jgi:hypothetical protein
VRDDRDVAIVVLLLLAVTCVTILILKLAEPTGGLVELLFPALLSGAPSFRADRGRAQVAGRFVPTTRAFERMASENTHDPRTHWS